MPTYSTEILVIGGGSTGSGVTRDLAMRGFDTIMVERYGVSQGTTRRYHGLLHSGGRYVVKDPEAAKECVQENRILRRIMPHAIDDTGGFFVVTPDDNPDFIDTFVTSAQKCGLAVERVDISQMLKEEPFLNPDISHCFWVPDAVSYAYLSTSSTVRSAADYGATILTHHSVVRLILEGDAVVGAVCEDARGKQVTIHADYVVNATGPLAGTIAAMANVPVQIVPGKGTMVSIDSIPLRTVLNRCRVPTDGDIIVPKRGEAVVGTTDMEIENPDQFGVTGVEIDQMLQAGEAMLPGYSQAPNIRAWAGVRPLFRFENGNIGDTRQVTRSHALLDHEERDGIAGLITITGGKWTTHRLMAEETVDLVCAKLGTERPCRTHLETVTESLFDPE